MPDIKQLSKDEIEDLLDPKHWQMVNLWLERGDGIAAYENVEFGNPQAGHMQFVSFGSSAAQLEVEEPPERLPDIGAAINWRYHLVGVYKGDALGAALRVSDA